MTSPFTPYRIVLKEKRQRLALLLIILFVPTILFNFTVGVYASEESVWDSTTTLAQGTNSNTTESRGGVTLAYTASTSDRAREEFANGNNRSHPFTMTSLKATGGIEINQGYAYTNVSIPGLLNAGNYVWSSFREGDFLYMSTENGLWVIDTNGSINDPSDDTVVTTYNTTSTPALADNRVFSTLLQNDVLYVNTIGGGLSIIDTKGTTDASDDTLVHTYNTGGGVAIAGNNIWNTYINNNLLYVSAFGSGLSVIDSKGTFTDASDDTLVIDYSDTSTPALTSRYVTSSFMSGNLLYVNTTGGLSVIDTKGTTSAADDTLVTTYNTTSTPALQGNDVRGSFLKGSYLFIGTLGGGITVIDTKGTVIAGDDTVVNTYDDTILPSLYVWSLATSGNLIYVSQTVGGVSIIDTKGTTDPSDDSVTKTYDSGNPSGLEVTKAFNASFDANVLSISDSYTGLLTVLPGTYIPSALYLSNPQPLATTPTTSLSAVADVASGQTVALSYRTGTSDAVYFNDFDDGTTTEYLGDFYGWGSTFNTAVETGGTIKLSNPSPYTSGQYQSVDIWIDTGKVANYFPLGTTVTARVRVNSNTRQSQGSDYMYNDNWWDSNAGTFINNQWHVVTFNANIRAFSKIGFETVWKTNTWNNTTDSLEIDWIKITTPDSFGQWGSWVTCADITTCILPPLTGEWLQYKLDLTTTNPATTPIVHSVSYNGPHYTTGTYTSTTQLFARPTDFGTFSVDATTPTGTVITYEYTTDGNTWKPVTPGQVIGQTGTAFAWRAHLATTNPALSPTIHGVTVGTSVLHNVITSTRLHRIPQNYNEATQRKIITLLEQAIPLLQRLVELKNQ